MIKGTLTRQWRQTICTLGNLSLADEYRNIFFCYTCEDVERGGGDPTTVKDWKIKGESAIPKGTYIVRLTDSPRFGCKMWQLMDVPGFDGVRIHAGNTAADTEGCILVGGKISPNYQGVLNSREVLRNLSDLLALRGNEDWTLTII